MTVSLDRDVVPGGARVEPGEHVRLAAAASAPAAGAQRTYLLVDARRGLPLAIVAGAFALLALAVAALRGLAALVALGLAVAGETVFTLPALLHGQPAAGVALASGGTLVAILVFVGHGVSIRTATAYLGAAAAVLVATVGSRLVLGWTHLPAVEPATTALTTGGRPGPADLFTAASTLVAAAFVAHVAAGQARVLWTLAAAPAGPRGPRLARAALRAGREQAASLTGVVAVTVAAAGLPALALFSVNGVGTLDAATSGEVGALIAQTALIGLAVLVAVLVTTAAGAFALRR
jgi:uncharacterized membrane protein